ncbi:MAG: hypothetical protein KDA69_05465 [Planctomycetaceae bacterium]|nr:hypothetical protein [Planctomycetaceae bacterium]
MNPRPLMGPNSGEAVVVRASYEELVQAGGASTPAVIYQASEEEEASESWPSEPAVDRLLMAWPRVSRPQQIGDVPVLPPANSLLTRTAAVPSPIDGPPSLPQRGELGSAAGMPAMEPDASAYDGNSAADGDQYSIQILNAKSQSVLVFEGSTFPAAGSTKAAAHREREGVILSVTPHVGQDGLVTIDAAAEKCQITTDSGVSIIAFSDVAGGNRIPALGGNETSSKAVFKAQSGETIFLGSVIADDGGANQDAIPFMFFSPLAVEEPSNVPETQPNIEQASTLFEAELTLPEFPTVAPQFGTDGLSGVGAIVPSVEATVADIREAGIDTEFSSSLSLDVQPVASSPKFFPDLDVATFNDSQDQPAPVETLSAKTAEREQRGIIPASWRRFPWVITSRPTPIPAVETPQATTPRTRPSR